MVRGTWLSKVDEAHAYGLPSKLLAHLRALLKADCAGLPPRTPEDGVRLPLYSLVLHVLLFMYHAWHRS